MDVRAKWFIRTRRCRVPSGYAEEFGNVMFDKGSLIDEEFKRRTRTPFIQWFNDKIAGRQAWFGKKMQGSNLDYNFIMFWAQFISSDNPITLMEFITYMSDKRMRR
jgi:hypothetical protein